MTSTQSAPANETLTSVSELKSSPSAGGQYLLSVHKPGASETGATARENQAVLRSLVPAGKRLPLLVDSRKIGAIDKEAREVYASENTATFATCVAIVGDNPFVAMLANVFLALSNPKCPTKLFGTEDAALKWMAEHRAD